MAEPAHVWNPVGVARYDCRGRWGGLQISRTSGGAWRWRVVVHDVAVHRVCAEGIAPTCVTAQACALLVDHVIATQMGKP